MKGQVGDLGALGFSLLTLGIVFAVGIVVLATFQTVVAPDQNTTLSNTTNLNTTGATVQADHYVFYDEYEHGAFLNGTVTTTVTLNESDPLNYTVTVNGNVIGLTNGYNETGTLALTLAQLVNGENNVSYMLYNSTNVTQTTLSLTWEKWTDTGSKDIVGDTIDVYDDVVDWLPIIVIVVIVSLVLGLLGFGFGRRE